MTGEWTAYLGQSLQLLLGAVFFGAALGKLKRPSRFVVALRDYELIPPALSRPVASIVVAIELVVAISLLTGWALGASVPLAIVVLLAFAAAVSVNLRRGRVVPCGCFGSVSERISLRTLARIGLLLVAGIGLVTVRISSLTPLDVASLIQDGTVGLEQLVFTAAFAVFLLMFGTWLLHIPELTVVLRPRMKGEGG